MAAADASDRRAAGARLAAMVDLVVPMAIRVFATLRIADHLAAGRTAPELAAVAGADPVALERMLRHLAGAGVVDRNDDGEYALTAMSEFLVEGDESGARARLDIDGALGRAELAFVQLLHTVRTGAPAYDVQFGRPFWDDLASDAVRLASFDAAMGADVAAWAPAIVTAFDWSEVGHVVDVGGGNATLLIALLAAFPELRGTVFDLPDTAAAAGAALAGAGLTDRADAVGGNFFESVPAGAGAYVLTAIIHDWDDEPAREILRTCRDAAGTGGRVFVIEKIGTDGRTPNTDMDLRLLVHMGGRERSLEELGELAESAGLGLVQVHPAGAIAILEFATD